MGGGQGEEGGGSEFGERRGVFDYLGALCELQKFQTTSGNKISFLF